MNYMTDGVETDESHDALMNKFTALKSFKTKALSDCIFSECIVDITSWVYCNNQTAMKNIYSDFR